MPLPPGSGHAVDCGSSPTHQKHCLTLHARHARPDPQTKKRWLRSVAVMPKRSPLRSSLRCGPVLRPCSPDARQSAVIFKAAPLPVSQRVPPANGSPPSPRTTRDRRPGSLKITQIVQHCGGGVVTQAATLPANAAYPRRLHLPRQLAGIRHASPSASLPVGLWAGRGAGSLSLAGTCPHAADGPQQLRATMSPAPFQNASRRSPSSPYVLKRRTAGLDMPHGGTPPTGHGPFGCPQPVWRAKAGSSFHAERLFNDSP